MEQQPPSSPQERPQQPNYPLPISYDLQQIIDEKERIISNLSEQITKYKCDEIKNQRLIKSLQDKINQLAPNIGNTTSTFIMASEFKNHFEEFMTTTLPGSLGWAIDRPFLFSKCTQDIFIRTYTGIQQELNIIIDQISKTLKISHLKTEGSGLEDKIKLSILKILQQNWETILPIKQDRQYEYINRQGSLSSDFLDEINEGVSSQDFIDMERQLYRLCVYMNLQEKPWEFVNINKGQRVKYNKKQYTCIDGWVKEGNEALLVLGGIIKDGNLHPNLKNYVIPITQDENVDAYKHLQLRIKEQVQSVHASKPEISIQNQPISVEKEPSSRMQNSEQSPLDNQVEMMPLQPIFIGKSQVLVKSKSKQIIQNKENYPYAINKKPKKKEKLKYSMETSLNLPEKSPKNILRRHDESIKNRKIDIEEVDQRAYMIREESKAKKKSTMICKNANEGNMGNMGNIHDLLLPLKDKNIEDLPMSKQANHKKKTKANTSRKNSVGKIVNQNHMINHDKQNTQNINNSKMKNKEKAYKDIIKEKLLDDKISDKTQNSINIMYPKVRSDREKKKEQNRPLKIQNNASKLREKYIF